MPPAGPPSLTLLAASGQASTFLQGQVLAEAPAWSPDGALLVARAYPADELFADGVPSAPATLTLVDAASRTTTPLADADGAPLVGHSAAWSPDGLTIAFVQADDNSARLLTVRPGGGAFTAVYELNGAPTSPQWAMDGTALVVAQSAQDSTEAQVHTIDVATGEARSLPLEGRVAAFTVAPDGGQLAYITLGTPNSTRPQLCLYDLRADANTCYDNTTPDANARPVWR